ncbi:MAG: right-handed parallel beta-helix repeat-containing protein [Bacteroidaceae bacterium]|nr:right-handed parallel beta-helix repeat-containing protein [Bacteroidaceae bacterium]
MKVRLLSMMVCTLMCIPSFAKKTADLWPDGTEIGEWFRQTEPVDVKALGKKYRVTDYGVVNDGKLHTQEMQALIDKVAADGGGLVVVPEGTYMTGALFFKQGVHLHIYDGGTLMGSSDPSDYPILKTRMEGETCLYYAALINADGLDGFTISGKGTIDGNGFTYWKHFWERRSWNPRCTNKDEQRPRLVYVSNSKNVQIEGVKLQNSAFWTTHIYHSENVKLLRLHIYSPAQPVKAPSTDAIDLDVVKNILVKDCYMSVNDDAVAIKGGKGPYADYWRTTYNGIDINKFPEMVGDGGNENIIIEDCEYGFCHGCLTLGSESVYDHNIILRRIKVNEANNLLWLKMRPDTPQQYEYVTVEDIEGNGKNFLLVAPWTQFYDLKGRESVPMSYSDHITMRNIDFDCNVFFNVKQQEDQYHLSNFTFENLTVRAKNNDFHPEYVENFVVKNVKAEKKQ